MEFYEATPDPWFLWPARGLFSVLAIFIVWTLYARRRELEAFVVFWGQKAWRFGKRVYRRWSGLLGSRAFWGGLIIYITWRANVSLPPEAQSFVTDVLFAVIGTGGLFLNAIGRILAKSPLIAQIMGEDDPDGPLIGNGSQAAIEGRTPWADSQSEPRPFDLAEFLRGEKPEGAFSIVETPADPQHEDVIKPPVTPKRKRKAKKTTKRRAPSRGGLAHA